MATDACSITIHMVASLDGYIAKKDNSVSWFETTDNYEKGMAGQDPETFLKSIDCYVMGAHTYEHARALSTTYGWPYGEKPTFVLTSRNLPADRPTVKIFNCSLETLVSEWLKPYYKRVWVAGGPLLAASFLRQNLADDIILTVLPIILGDGLPFFGHIQQEQALHLKDVSAYKNGMVELCYAVKKG